MLKSTIFKGLNKFVTNSQSQSSELITLVLNKYQTKQHEQIFQA